MAWQIPWTLLRFVLLPLVTFWVAWVLSLPFMMALWPLMDPLLQFAVFGSRWFWFFGYFNVLVLVLLHLGVGWAAGLWFRSKKKSPAVVLVSGSSVLATAVFWLTCALAINSAFPGMQWVSTFQQVTTPVSISAEDLQQVAVGDTRAEVERKIGRSFGDGEDFSLFKLQDVAKACGWNIRVYWQEGRVARPPIVEWYD